MKKYVIALILGFIVVLHNQSVYAQVDATIKNVLIDPISMKTITSERLSEYIAQGADVNAKDENQLTPLMIASIVNQNPTIVTALINKGADVNARTLDGLTPLMFAAGFNQNFEVTMVLLNKGANINARSADGMSPLIFAALFNTNSQVLETLLKHGAKVDDAVGDMDVLMLLSMGQEKAMELTASEAGIDLNLFTKRTPDQEIKIVEMLMDSEKIDVNYRDNDGLTPLMLAATYNPNPKIIELLINKGAKVNARSNDGLTPLIYAASNNQNPEIITTLLDKGASLDAEDTNGLTPLMYAASNNQNPEITTALIENGASLDAEDTNGLTPLIYAILHNPNPKVIQTLLDKGAKAGDINQLIELLDENENIEKNQDYWDLRDRIYNATNR